MFVVARKGKNKKPQRGGNVAENHIAAPLGLFSVGE